MSPLPSRSDGSRSGIELGFYDHARQTYGHMPIREDGAVAEFMVGDYGDSDQGVGRGGEFAIYLYRFDNRPFGSPAKPLSVQLQVFDDAFGSLRRFDAIGALALIEKSDIWNNDDLAAVLLGAGLRDRSRFREPMKTCKCCHGAGKVAPDA
jgi:hypothetical protein